MWRCILNISMILALWIIPNEIGAASTPTEISGEIFAFFDANYDRYTDLLVRRNKNQLSVYLASTEDATFVEDARFSVDLSKFHDQDFIVNVGVGDFNGDANPDLLITSVSNAQAQQTKLFNATICFGTGSSFSKNCQRPTDWIFAEQPMILNCDEDGLSDFFTVLPNNTRICVFGSFEANATEFRLSSEFDIETPYNLFNYSAQAFVDITGDLNADVVLLVANPSSLNKQLPSFEVWQRNSKPDGWTLTKDFIPDPLEGTARTPKLMDHSKDGKFKFGHVVYDDFNRDGKVDILLPLCGDECKELTLLVWSIQANWTTFKIPLTENWAVAFHDKAPTFEVRSGDYTQNGFPDLLIILEKMKTEKDEAGNGAFFVENVPCGAAGATCAQFGRDFKMSWQPVAPCKSLVKTASYFDLNEDGTLDVLYECKDQETTSNEASSYKIQFSPSAYSGDTTFLKVETYTATCANCENGKEGSGISLAGAALSYEMIDTDGNSIRSAYTQQSCTTYKALLLPYALFGLGRTPNFVDKLHLGIPSSTPPMNQTWQQIVPNSRMYAIPYPPDQPSHWIGRLYVTPSRLILMSLAALGGVCALIIMTILVLHWYEIRADRKERELQKKHFHFDAM